MIELLSGIFEIAVQRTELLSRMSWIAFHKTELTIERFEILRCPEDKTLE